MTNLDLKINPESENTLVFMGDNESPAEIIATLQQWADLISPDTAAKLDNDQELLGRAMSAIRAAGLTIPAVLLDEKDAIESRLAKREQTLKYLSSQKSAIQHLLDQIEATPAKKVSPKKAPVEQKKTKPAASVEKGSESQASPQKKTTKPQHQDVHAIADTSKPEEASSAQAESAGLTHVTSRPVIRQAVVDAIATLGGRASKREVLDIMETTLESVLTPDDKKQYRPGRNEKVWQATAGWVISDLKREGLARTDVKAGVWALA